MNIVRKNRVLLIIVSILVVIIFIFYHTTSINRNHENIKAASLKISYEKAINVISEKVVDLTSLNDLLLIDEFKSILANSDVYYNNAVILLAQPNIEEQEKLIIIYSMQNLSYNNYINFFIKSSDLYKRHLISENLITHIIVPGSDWNNLIINGFYKYKIRTELKSLRKVGGSQDFIYGIDEIISGKIWFRNLTEPLFK